MSTDQLTVWVSAFIGRSFLPEDDAVWVGVRNLLESLGPTGFQFEDAERAEPKRISKKITDRIDRNETYIGILTRRYPIYSGSATEIDTKMKNQIPPDEWGTSAWVIEECGYALGKAKRVLLMIEDGVNFPKSDLDGDQERIIFNRDNLLVCFPKLVSMIGHLVAERVPQLPATTASQVITPPEPAAPAIAPKGAHTLGDVLDLVEKNLLKEADLKFEDLMRTAKNDLFRSYILSRYLSAKATRGDAESLKKLESLCEKNENLFPWAQLAKFHADFNRHPEAIEILLRGAKLAGEEDRTMLLDIAAGYYADKQDYKAAYGVMRLLPEHKSKVDRSFYLSLADIAKRSKDFGLESASLEMALELNPADGETRFRLAYLYGEHNKRHLAIYHYKIQLKQGFDEVVANNLGNSFGEAGLAAKEVESLAMAKHLPLATANLANAYIDRGFLDQGESLARQALKSDDDTALKRAAYAIERIAETRENEEKLEKSLCMSAESESKVRAGYSEAFFGKQTRPLNGTFKGEFGVFEIKQDECDLTGTFEESELVPGISLAGVNLSTVKKTTTLKFEAKLLGRCGKYRLERNEKTDGVPLSILSPKNWTQEGLMIVAEDGTSFQLLNETKTPCELSLGRKVD